MRFLHAADLHIDSPLRGLDRYEGAPVERLRSATRRALEALVETAVAERVGFVLLAGDIYDRDWPDFRTGLFFREQMVRLERAGIPVFIAHGNHDAEGQISRRLTLPGNVTVFSSRTAQTVRLDHLGVAIHGRSFPDRAVTEDFVPDYPAPVAGCFNIGVLHTSLTGREGHDTYAPTTVDTLVGKGYDYWALGHVHAREVVHDRPRIVFPGCLQGRHANELGPKGCELVTVEPGGRVVSEPLALDVARWGHVVVALDGLSQRDELVPRLRQHLAQAVATAPDRLHALRVTLTGATALHAAEAATPGSLEAAVHEAAQDLSGAEVWIERVRLHLSSPLDRAAAAQRPDAVGELVRLADTLATDDDALVAWARQALGDPQAIAPPDVGGEELRTLLDPAVLRTLLADAEATVLARLGAAAGEAAR